MAEFEGCAATWRGCLRLSGGQAREVLQGVVSNDVVGLGPGRAVYAALLTPQGKYLFDFFLVEDTDGTILIDVADDRAEALAQRIRMYGLRREMSVAAAPEVAVGLIWPGRGASHPP
ncbi:MAG: folate-binding protein, partial [Pikeienuella sp.]